MGSSARPWPPLPAAARGMSLHPPHFPLGQPGPESQAWRETVREGWVTSQGHVWGIQKLPAGRNTKLAQAGTQDKSGVLFPGALILQQTLNPREQLGSSL